MTQEEIKTILSNLDNFRSKNPGKLYDLTGADFKGIYDLSHIDFSDIMLKESYIMGVNFDYSCLSNVSFFNAKVSFTDFLHTELMDCDFTYSECNSLSFCHADIQGVVFAKAELDNISFTHANLRGADFKDAYLSNVDFHYANLDYADFRGWKEGSNVDFSKAKIDKTFFTEEDYNRIQEEITRNTPRFIASNTLQVMLKEHKKFVDTNGKEGELADFRNTIFETKLFSNIDLRFARFKQANLNGIKFINVNLANADLSYTDLTNAEIVHCNLLDTDFTGANMIDTFLHNNSRNKEKDWRKESDFNFEAKKMVSE